MKYTSNFGLKKPEPLIDNVSPDPLNDNSDIIDAGLTVYLGVTSGSGNTYAISSDKIISLNAGLGVCVKFHAASTAASTLNINGLGAKAIKKPGGTDVTNLKEGLYTLRYDGTNFILQGEGASGDATASDLLLGKKATTDVGEITGTMPDNGPDIADVIELNTQNQEYSIPIGKHSGLRKIKAVITGLVASVIKAGITVGGVLGTFTSDATAVDANVLATKTYYRNGVKGTGSMVNHGSGSVAGTGVSGVAGRVSIVPPQGYHTGVGWAYADDPDFIASNFLNTANVFGLQGGIQIVNADIGDQVAARTDIGAFASGGYSYTGVWPYRLIGAANWVRCAQPDILPQNILTGKTIYGQAGTIPRVVTGQAYASNGIGGDSVVTSAGDAKNRLAHAYINIPALPFRPKMIEAHWVDNWYERTVYIENPTTPGRQCIWLGNGGNFNTQDFDAGCGVYIQSAGSKIPVTLPYTDKLYTWKAYE
jgi:hypothetical protein